MSHMSSQHYQECIFIFVLRVKCYHNLAIINHHAIGKMRMETKWRRILCLGCTTKKTHEVGTLELTRKQHWRILCKTHCKFVDRESYKKQMLIWFGQTILPDEVCGVGENILTWIYLLHLHKLIMIFFKHQSQSLATTIFVIFMETDD